MLQPDERCRNCGQLASRTLAMHAYCTECAESVLQPLRDAVHARMGLPEGFDGYGQRGGPNRDDWGGGWSNLECNQCTATWVGPNAEPCPWCIDRYQDTIERQSHLVTLPPDNPSAFVEWGQRLKRAVEVGIITDTDARHAWERARTPAA